MRTKKPAPIVTKESLIAMLLDTDRAKVERVVGRALIALFNRQTQDERSANVTDKSNGIGFTGADAESGCISAKTYILHGRFTRDWQLDRWLKPNKHGVPRLAKYHAQLNEIALARAARKAQV